MELTFSPAQKKLLYSLVVSLALLGLLIGLVIYPLINSIRTASSKYLANQEVLNGLREREVSAKEIERIHQKNQANLDKVEMVFLKQRMLLALFPPLRQLPRRLIMTLRLKLPVLLNLMEKIPFSLFEFPVGVISLLF